MGVRIFNRNSIFQNFKSSHTWSMLDSVESRGSMFLKSKNFLLRFLGICYGLLLILTLSRLPIEAFWIRHSPFKHDWDSVNSISNSTSTLVEMPAIIYFGAVLKKKFHWSAINCATAVLLFFMSFSTIWSTNKTLTLSEISLLIFCVVSMAGFFSFLNFRSSLTIFFTSLQIPIIASFWAAHHRWGLERRDLDNTFTGAWQGIFTNRNFLSTMCLLATLFGCALLFDFRRDLNKFFIILILSLTTLDIFVLYQTRSGTHQGALYIFLGLELFFMSVIKLFGRQIVAKRKIINLSTTALMLSFIGFLLLCYFKANDISTKFGKSSGLSGRTIIWFSQLKRVFDRPILGWGWMSPLWTDSFRVKMPSELNQIYWSHSSHLDFLLGIGLVGFFFYILWIMLCLQGLISDLNSRFGHQKLAIFLTLLITLSFEALSKGFHYIFALALILPMTIPQGLFGKVSKNSTTE